MLFRKIRTDRFIYGELVKNEDKTKDQADTTTPEPPTEDLISIKFLYFMLNTGAVLVHLLNAILIIVLHITHFSDIKPGYVFVSPVAQLDWTNHALIKADATSNRCAEVSASPHFKSTLPLSGEMYRQDLFPPRTPYPDFMDHRLYDFSGMTLIRYNYPGNSIHLNWMMMSFCLLSAVFQTLHGIVLYYDDQFPRILHYIEYSISSPLMIMVMAVNVGILEVFTITGLAFLFFGMNILGMCAEAMSHYAGHIDRDQLTTYTTICKAAHFAGWAMFFAAMVPIWTQFNRVIACSENNGTPTYAYAAIVIESILFIGFGVVQYASLVGKYTYVWGDKEAGDSIPPTILFRYDCMHAVFSVAAKTFLVWLLLGPALSVNKSMLT